MGRHPGLDNDPDWFSVCMGSHTVECVSSTRPNAGFGAGRERLLLERYVLERSVDIAFAGLLLAFSLPLLAFYSVLAKLDSASPAPFRRLRMGRRLSPIETLNLQFAEEFGFEHAIEAYEQLIDSTLASRRP
jgi:hypothetical protein